MSILKDGIRPLDPSSLQEFLEPDRETEADRGSAEPLATPPSRALVEARRRMSTPAEDDPASLRPHVPMGETSFELASRGGYMRTVTGTVAYLDEEAQTYMVLRGNGDGELLRVPLRDITSAHQTATSESDREHAGRDAEGLGTGL